MSDLGIRDKKRLIVFNKTDCIEPDEALNIAARYDGLRVSALHRETLTPLLGAIEVSLWESGSNNTSP